MKLNLCYLYVVFIFLPLKGVTQIIGNISNEQSLPKEATSSKLNGGVYAGNVNTFTGAYTGSYNIGSVSTTGGLSYSLSLMYNSTLTGGNNVPIASGIPYGEGWSLNIPTISVRTTDYKKYHEQYLAYLVKQANQSSPQINQELLDLESFDKRTGDLYWFSPQINIPGVASGRAIFVRTLEGCDDGAEFALYSFDQNYIKIVMCQSTWTVYLTDGTQYVFNTPTISYRSGVNQRCLKYDTPLYDIFNNGSYYSLMEEAFVRQSILPKEEVLEWKCTAIRNANKPTQTIRFEYESFGEFNFFKEFSSEYQKSLSLILASAQNSFFDGLPDLTVYKDAFLKRLVANDAYSIVEELELEYRTFESYGLNMLNYYDNSVFRKDSLYNYKVIYSANDQNPFSGWRRYYHGKRFADSSSQWVINDDNPYIINSNIHYNGYFQTSAVNGQMLAFDHGFLESEHIVSNDIVPGDIYEIKTTIANNETNHYNFCNFDINVAAVDNRFPDYVVGGNKIDAPRYSKRRTSVFSTFGNAVKWNTAGNNSSHIETSNYFVLPNLPSDYYQGLYIQVGPGTSDNHFSIDPNDPSYIRPSLNAFQTYYDYVYTHSPGVVNSKIKYHFESVPNNFGVGLPWHMMVPYYNQLADGVYNETSQVFDFWWNNHTYAGTPPQRSNEPTLANDKVYLKNVELIRYSKNPYMLHSVKKYVHNGEYYQTTDSVYGRVLINQYNFKYKRDTAYVAQNFNYQLSNTPNTIVYAPYVHNVYLLKAIEHIPVNPTQNLTVADTITALPTTFFDYNLRIDPNVNYDSLYSLKSLFLLTDITDEIGKEVSIDYYSFDSTKILQFPLTNYRFPFSVSVNPPEFKEPFAVSTTIPVKSVEVKTDTSLPRRWDYNYGNTSYILEPAFGYFIPQSPGYFYSADKRYASIGFDTAIVLTTEINGERNKTKYTYNTTSLHLHGKPIKTETFDANGKKVKEEVYQYNDYLAFKNAMLLPGGYSQEAYHNGNSRKWISDYDSYFLTDSISKIEHSPFMPMSIGNSFFYDSTRFMESLFPDMFGANYLNAHFTGIKKQTSTDEKDLIEEIIYEGFGPNGVAIIVETMTDNKNRSAAEVRSTFSKYNGNLGVSGCVKHNFKKVGIISYSKSISSFEDFFDYCVSLDVDDVTENENDFILETNLDSFNTILQKMENKFSIPKFSEIEWKPLNFINVSDEDSAKVLIKLLEKLEDLDDVQSVSSNFNINDSLMEKII